MSIIKGHLVPTRGIADTKDTQLDKPSVLKDTMKPVSPERANEEAHFSKIGKGTLNKELKKTKPEEPGEPKENT